MQANARAAFQILNKFQNRGLPSPDATKISIYFKMCKN